VLSLTLPWLTSRMMEYSTDLIHDIPDNISASSN